MLEKVCVCIAKGGSNVWWCEGREGERKIKGGFKGFKMFHVPNESFLPGV
jgi:hypothetical protein